MAGKQLGAYYNTIGFRTDMKQLRHQREMHKKFAKELQGYYSKVRIAPVVGLGKMQRPSGVQIPYAPNAPKSSQQPKSKGIDSDDQDMMIEKFLKTNKYAKQLNKQEKAILETELRREKTHKRLRHQIGLQGNRLKEHYQTQQNLLRTEQKRNFMAQRMNASWMQMAGSAASMYTAVAGIRSSIDTGMQMEGLQKAFVVVSEDADDAKQNMKWLTDEAQRLGLGLVDAGRSYSGFLAAMSNKMETGTIRDIFTGVSEASVALGLDAEKQSRIFLAVKQMASKSKIQAEELTQQLGEGLPFAMRAMAQAAVNTGLIDGSLTATKREAALLKLTEQGKLIAADILPEFGEELRKLANNNDGLAKALKENLSPALQRAKNNVTLLSNSFYEGMKPALMDMLKGFTDATDNGGSFAKMLGGAVGGALKDLAFLIQLPVALLMDFYTIVKNITGASDDFIGELLRIAAAMFMISKAMGAIKLASGVMGKIKGWGGVAGGKNATKATGSIAESIVGGMKSANTAKNVGTGLRAANIAKNAVSLSNPWGWAMMAAMELPRAYEWRKEHSDYGYNQNKYVQEKYNIKVTVDGEGNIAAAMENKVAEMQNRMLSDAQSQLTGNNN